MLNVVRVHHFQLSLAVAAACWGGATVISKRAIEEIEPLTLLPLELTVSVAVLGIAMALRRERVGWSSEIAFAVAGVAACAVYTVLSSRFLLDATTVSVGFVQQVTALALALILFAGSLVLTNPRSLVGVSATAWLSAVVAGALYYGVAFCFYLAGLRGVTASVAGVFINLVPLFGITAGYFVLGEPLSSRQWLGATVVFAAVATTAFYTGRPASAEDRAQCVEARGDQFVPDPQAALLALDQAGIDEDLHVMADRRL